VIDKMHYYLLLL